MSCSVRIRSFRAELAAMQQTEEGTVFSTTPRLAQERTHEYPWPQSFPRRAYRLAGIGQPNRRPDRPQLSRSEILVIVKRE